MVYCCSWRCRSRIATITVYWLKISAFLLFTLFIVHSVFPQQQITAKQAITANRTADKLVLYWTKYSHYVDFSVGFGQKPFGQCPSNGNNCRTTNDRTLFNVSDAVVFHGRDINVSDLPKWRFARQVFILLNYESPADPGLQVLKRLPNHFFNRTMTYRRDSDIVSLHPYGNFRRRSAPAVSSIKNNNQTTTLNLSKKNKTIAWFVSHCKTDSRREMFVQQLSKHIAVDIYGKCGPLQCLYRKKCYAMLKDQYRFYLSFENSLCPDYVTEKLYRPMGHDVVPITFGGVDYSLFLPHHSYIDVKDFGFNAKKLADYLHFLMENDPLYLGYFHWKWEHEIVANPMDGWCQMCRLLNDNSLEWKSYENISKWWFEDRSCLQTPLNLNK